MSGPLLLSCVSEPLKRGVGFRFWVMKVRIACLVLVLGCFRVVAFSQERKSIDWFYQDANYHSKKLLLKLLQFTTPYPGYYEETSVDTDGNAFTGRIVPNWAIQGSVNAKLDDALLGQIKQMLAQLSVPSTSAAVQPQPGQMHTAVVFYDGHEFMRVDYNGPNPAQIDAILKILHKQFMAAVQKRLEEFAAHERFIKETYGDWQNRSDITINAGGPDARLQRKPGVSGIDSWPAQSRRHYFARHGFRLSRIGPLSGGSSEWCRQRWPLGR